MDWYIKTTKKNNKKIYKWQKCYIFSLLEKGAPIGFFILDYREEKVCELSHIGLTSESLGKGLGKYLFKTAILTAWDKKEITKLKVNTCSLDHKSALPLYQKLGFNPVLFKDTKRLKTFFN